MGIVHFISLALIAMLLPQNLYSQTDWVQKIAPSILQAASDEGTADFIILLMEQAEVSEARFLPLKEDKGRFVFQKLSETAERTQGRLLKILRQHQAPHQSFWIVNAIQAKGGLELLQTLAKLPEVALIQPNTSLRFQEPERPLDAGSRAITWGIDYINADDVWALGYTGQGTVIGGQDTGYKWDHAALKLKYRGWDNNTQTADHNYNWHDAIHQVDPHNTGPNPCGLDLTEPCDDNNHGTHTMGTMTGDDGAANQIGVAPDAKWIGCRNMERGWGMLSTYMECFQWLLAPTDLNNQNANSSLAPDVINNSWYCPESEGCQPSDYPTMEAVVNNLRSAGVVVVASAGNSGSSCATISYPPAIFQGSFSVGATDINGQIASFSSRGPTTYNGSTYIKPNVSAPGVNVYSSIANGGYASFNGTSMAGPHVAGVVALIISANPSLAGQVSQIEDILESTATGKTTTQDCGSTPGSQIPNNTFGYGIINALAAVNQALTILPLELLSFTGNWEEGGARLRWEVALPGTLNHFDVERATKGKLPDWGIIGKLPFLPTASDYALFDSSPMPGTNYYRLKMVDIDGSVTYSKIIALERAGDEEWMVYPNPVVNGLLNIAGKEVEEAFEIRIYDSVGRCVKWLSKSSGNPDLQLELHELPAGTYYLRRAPSNGKRSPLQSRFIKLH